MTNEKLPVLAVTMGDPAGVGPEIVLHAAGDPEIGRKAALCVIGEKHALAAAADALNKEIDIREIASPAEYTARPGTICLINTATLTGQIPWGRISKEGGAVAYETIKKANKLALAGEVDAVVTAPIHKESLKAASVPYIDHTTMFIGLTGTEHGTMTMFATGNLKVFFLTRHISLREVPDAITADVLTDGIHSTIGNLASLGITNPKVAVAALNPHGGEHGLFGTEEDTVIRPVIETLQNNSSLQAELAGPVPADAVFHQCAEGTYDAVLSLYHDQGHIAAKTLDFHGTVSFTLGLPYLRTSVDHGTAFDVAGTGKANPRGMKEAILEAVKFARSYKRQGPRKKTVQ